jgi:chemotaxis protein histidine kinase CheA
MAAFRARFLERAAAESERLEKVLMTLRQGENNTAATAEMTRLAHGLAGAGGTFGFPEVSVAAAEAENASLAQPLDAAALSESGERLLAVLGKLSRSC